ncbi:hypothetical protein SUGI_1191510 [Cryptomeria japonica]|uniref:uncharacterized protein LOC131063153 isoform X1 n=1 Tax=Cryptomeria japonica TaxID=3369 RepID=UPI002414A219|nr:uncharacterized protein LOC131063153 isoform X1 [Cryptomeria japonica]GLJ55484.1 hypothetical protein SUGI_1191510 [Cryptomeria japonica]
MPLISQAFIISKPEFRQLLVTAVSLNKNNVMAQTTSDKVGAQKRIEDSTSKEHEGIDQDKKLGTLSRDIVPHILNLYGCSAKAHDFEIYAPNATFEDPFMSANGVKQIKSAFYSIPKILSEGKIVEYSVQENETSPGSGEILIDNKQHYKVMGKTIDLTSLIALQVEHGKIIRHEDRWGKGPLKNRHTVSVPLVGRVAEGFRKCTGLITHAMMGFGKDPTPRH